MGASRDGVGGPTATEPICGSCGAHSSSPGKFCGECGARLTQATRPAEYKQVTVLFADVVRSMDIAAALDMERLRDIMTEVVERSTAVAQRYGATVEHTGDGVMAIFGAPTALEDHAFRACVAALAIQDEMRRLAAEVQSRDDVALQVRVGLNSGRVIAGDIGTGSLGYAATGEPVGFAQRMEAAAPAGGVLISESTARLVEDRVVLADPEWVHIKGTGQPVGARRLIGIGPRDRPIERTEATLVGRRWEMATLDAMVDRAIGGFGGVVNVVGPPGIGKSRTARETAALAAGRGVEVYWTFCESHAGDVPFRVVAQLLRVRIGVTDLDGDAARARVREQLPDADPQDVLLREDLLGIADPDVPPPQADPDARRRRLTALINAASLARTAPMLFIIEDAQWIDAVSESMLAGIFAVIPHTPSLVLITARPEYHGAMKQLPGAQTIALAPLGASDTAELLGELLGSDPSVGELGQMIGERAAENPFFAEEMVRELVQRGGLAGEHGKYVCRVDVAEVAVPAIQNGVLRADETAVREIEEALQIAEGLSGDTALGLVKGGLSGVLLSLDAPAQRHRGLELMTEVRDMWLRERSRLYLIPIADVFAARETARRGDRDGAIPVMRKAVNQMYQAGRFGYGVPVTAILVETLLDRGEEGDLPEAQSAIDRLANVPEDERSVVRDVWLLRLRALLARARGNESAYRDYRDRYRTMAESLGFEGHIAWAQAMVEGGG